MAFIFSPFAWARIAQDTEAIRAKVETSLNDTDMSKHGNICAPFQVRDVYFGTEPPRLELLELSELSMNSFRAIISFSCSNNGYLVLNTKVQANPISGEAALPQGMPPGVLAVNKPLIVPMQIRIVDLRLRALIRLSFHRMKGLTLAFLNDPIESVMISTTFDALPKLRLFLQREIEGKLRSALLYDLPDAIHQWSKKRIFDSEMSTLPHLSPLSQPAAVPLSERTISNLSLSPRASSWTSYPEASQCQLSSLGLPCLLEHSHGGNYLQRGVRMRQCPTQVKPYSSLSPLFTRHAMATWLNHGKGDNIQNLFYFSDVDIHSKGQSGGLYFGQLDQDSINGRGSREILLFNDIKEEENLQVVKGETCDISGGECQRSKIESTPAHISSNAAPIVNATTSVPFFSFVFSESKTSYKYKIDIYKCTAAVCGAVNSATNHTCGR